MKKLFLIIICIVIVNFMSCQKNSISSMKMSLSAFGVESDDFPSIEGMINFNNDSSFCIKSFYNPNKIGLQYKLTKEEINTIKNIIEKIDLENCPKKYHATISDQPRSVISISTNTGVFIIDDYGLIGEKSLQEIYKIVYRF